MSEILKNLYISDFDYKLPKKVIAKYPSQKRDEAKLLVVDKKRDKVSDKKFYNILDYLKNGDLLILNETKVLPVRLFGNKQGMKKLIEILLIRPLGENWLCLVRPGKRLKTGDSILFSKDFTGKIIETNTDGSKEIKLISENNFSIKENIKKYGNMPIPPYLKRDAEEKDKIDYQTVYAKNEGSVASPTSGLHWTKKLLGGVKEKGVDIEKITLSIGLGTFLPVSVDKIEEHKMHSESFTISKRVADKINAAKKNSGRIIACGTTVIRALEAAGETGKVRAINGSTDIFIYPPYDFKIVDGLITN
ncbi:MAG: tRNA preQ1(34) S-adenosylmethionine ribosyltransferase-isomerase QueA, partial [Clostridiales Family XIII bacterium]|nr:tRNA preQ1(34) S-adenosylmethionine ribosyltransferase-isomerase QueA [Clostridiales Family XIII bacterium]